MPEQKAGVTAASIFDTPDIGFDEALRQAMDALHLKANSLAQSAAVSDTWLEALVTGGVASIDVPALRALARALNLSEPDFVARGVKHLIAVEIAAAPD